jgi:predicted ATPase
MALWMLGYPDAALTDAAQALRVARESGHAAVLMHALGHTPLTYVQRGNYAAAGALTNELISLAEEKDALFWKAAGMIFQGGLFVLTGKAADAVEMITSGIIAWRSTGATAGMPSILSNLARAYGELGQLDDAWRCIGEAITEVETTKATIYEAQVYRTAGEIALMSPEPDATKAEAYFERALTAARQQQAKSWELRAAMSLARLWRDQGKVQQARELLAPVYSWFTEGFETRDLKDAKALLEEWGRNEAPAVFLLLRSCRGERWIGAIEKEMTDQMIPSFGKLSKRIAKEVRYFICHARGKERQLFLARCEKH